MGSTTLGTKTEVKNMNWLPQRGTVRLSSRSTARFALIEDGGTVIQQTLLWDANQNVAVAMREQGGGARLPLFFRTPTSSPFSSMRSPIARIRKALPELPAPRRDRFVQRTWIARVTMQMSSRPKRMIAALF